MVRFVPLQRRTNSMISCNFWIFVVLWPCMECLKRGTGGASRSRTGDLLHAITPRFDLGDNIILF
jgi:hypothetical protein